MLIKDNIHFVIFESFDKEDTPTFKEDIIGGNK